MNHSTALLSLVSLLFSVASGNSVNIDTNNQQQHHEQQGASSSSLRLRGAGRRRLQEGMQLPDVIADAVGIEGGEGGDDEQQQAPQEGGGDIQDGGESSDGSLEVEEGDPQEEIPEPEEPVLTEEEIQQKQMRSYLGGLIPAVDQNILPSYLRSTSDTQGGYVMDLYTGGGEPILRDSDMKFFWHIPRTGGLTLKNIMNYCYGLRRPEQLEKEPSMEYVRNNIVNMDTNSPDGLQISYENQIVNSNMIDVIASNYFLSGSALFNEGHYGKAFTILRHPVEIAVSLFFHRRKYIAAWKAMTFYDYVDSAGYMDNWMVRQLTGTMPWVELTEKHLEQAKLAMKEKLFIGVLNEMPETLRQFKAHFGWRELELDDSPEGFIREETCEEQHLNDMANKLDHPGIPGGHGGRTWKIIIEKERWDMGLYYYGLELFAEQRNRHPPAGFEPVEEEGEAGVEVF